MNIQLSEFHKKLYEEYVRYFWYLAYDQSKSVTNNYFRIENVRSDEGDSKKFIEEVMKELEKSEWKVEISNNNEIRTLD